MYRVHSLESIPGKTPYEISLQKLFNVSTFLFQKKKYLLQLSLIEWIFCFHCFSVAKSTFISIISQKINTCNILSNLVFTKRYSKASIKKSSLSCSRAKKNCSISNYQNLCPICHQICWNNYSVMGISADLLFESGFDGISHELFLWIKRFQRRSCLKRVFS